MSFKKNKIVGELLRWYQQNKRDLPWRADRDPYKIWLSEIILQQTRVDQGLPYYIKFIEKYPTIHELANASEDDVLRTWQGLGYYSRARNLHKCAKSIVNQYNGKFPTARNELIKLPGIGPYTSAAIASFAFHKKEAVVDGNVMRVITRLYGIIQDISTPKTVGYIKSIVDELIPKSQPDIFNQAIMEFGALHCSPKNPSCNTCGFNGICYAQLNKLQDKIPFKSKKAMNRVRYFNYLLIKVNGKYLLRKRKNNDIWKGLFEFVLVETHEVMDFNHFPLPKFLTKNASIWKVNSESKTYKHILSHQTIFCRFYNINTLEEFEHNPMDWGEYQLYSEEEIHELPKSILIDRYLGEKIN